MKAARTWIVVHDGMPDHPKIEALTDRSFRALITLWCWCSRQLTDGRVPKSAWEKRTTPAVRRELIASGLVEQLPSGDVSMHDYLDWQRSAEAVREASEKKQAAARIGNHNRWHLRERRFDPTCELCTSSPTDPKPDAGAIAPVIADASHPEGSTDIGRNPQRRGEERRGESGLVGGEGSANGRAKFQDPPRPRCPRHAQLPADADVPPCGACREARVEAERKVADGVLGQLAERTARRAAIDACPLCDDNGMRETENGVARCNHPTKLEVVS